MLKYDFAGVKIISSRDNREMRQPRSFAIVAALTFPVFLTGCPEISSHDKVKEMWSPDGQTVATLYEENGGATTSFGYEVTLASKNSPEQKFAASLYGAARNREAYGVDLKWSDNSALVLECFSLKGAPKLSTPVHLEGRDVEIKLKTGVENASAPSGGMAYNLKRSPH